MSIWWWIWAGIGIFIFWICLENQKRNKLPHRYRRSFVVDNDFPRKFTTQETSSEVINEHLINRLDDVEYPEKPQKGSKYMVGDQMYLFIGFKTVFMEFEGAPAAEDYPILMKIKNIEPIKATKVLD